MRIGLLIIAVLALVAFVVVAVVLPQKNESEAKEAAQALVAGADAAKQQVASAAEMSGNLNGAGKEVKLAPQNTKHGELKWIVSENGSIRGWNEKNALEVALTPSMSGGKVAWSCRGYPVAAMPAGCGGR
jgi:hypothetical protein